MRSPAGDSLLGLATTPPESASGACGLDTSGLGCPEACFTRFIAFFPICAADFICRMAIDSESFRDLTLPVRSANWTESSGGELGLDRGRFGEAPLPQKIPRPMSSPWQIARHARSMRPNRFDLQPSAD